MDDLIFMKLLKVTLQDVRMYMKDGNPCLKYFKGNN